MPPSAPPGEGSGAQAAGEAAAAVELAERPAAALGGTTGTGLGELGGGLERPTDGLEGAGDGAGEARSGDGEGAGGGVASPGGKIGPAGADGMGEGVAVAGVGREGAVGWVTSGEAVRLGCVGSPSEPDGPTMITIGPADDPDEGAEAPPWPPPPCPRAGPWRWRMLSTARS